MDQLQSNQKWAASHTLVGQPNISLHRAKRKGKMRRLHHKLMVIDERVIIGGSFNYTGAANRLNDENIFILGNLKPDTQASIDGQKALAGYALDEIKRIVTEYGEPM